MSFNSGIFPYFMTLFCLYFDLTGVKYFSHSLADAFCSMMKGGNIGKQIIKISE